MKRWRLMKKGEGYGGNRPWWPHICGGLGYYQGGSAVAYVDLLLFRRLYFRVWQGEMPAYYIAITNPEMKKTSKEMRKATPA